MSLKQVIITSMTLALALGINTAAAQEAPAADLAATLAKCMLDNHTDEDEKAFKAVMIDALTDNTEALNRSALTMGTGTIMLATQHCGLKMTDLQAPHFKEAARLYGEGIDTKVIGNAMAKIGQ